MTDMIGKANNRAVKLMKRAINGTAKVVRLSPSSWDNVLAGEVEYKVGDYKVVFFSDGGELDYISEISRKGEVWTHSDFVNRFKNDNDAKGRTNPTDWLEEEDLNKLENILRSV